MQVWPLAMILLLAMVLPARADEPGVDFTLQLGRGKQSWEIGSEKAGVVVRSAGITLFEETTRRPELGLLAGRVLATTSGHPLTAGMTLDGHYAGIALRQRWRAQEWLTLELRGQYIYQDLGDRTDTQRVTVDWQEYGAYLDGRLALGNTLHLLMGMAYEGLEGEERASGTIQQNSEVHAPHRRGGHTGLELDTDEGEIRVVFRRGLNDAVEIYFQRSF